MISQFHCPISLIHVIVAAGFIVLVVVVNVKIFPEMLFVKYCGRGSQVQVQIPVLPTTKAKSKINLNKKN